MQYFTLSTDGKTFQATRSNVTAADNASANLEAFWQAVTAGTRASVVIPVSHHDRVFLEEYGSEGLPCWMFETVKTAVEGGINNDLLENALNTFADAVADCAVADRKAEAAAKAKAQQEAPVTVAHQQGGYQPRLTIEVRKGDTLFMSMTWSACEKRNRWDLTGSALNVKDDYGTMSQSEGELLNEITSMLQKAKCPSPKRTAKKAAQAVLAARPKHSAAYEYHGE